MVTAFDDVFTGGDQSLELCHVMSEKSRSGLHCRANEAENTM